MSASSDTAIASSRVTLPGTVDLHARPAAEFVRTAMRFTANVQVSQGHKTVDAKSLLSLLGLGARRGTELLLRAEGEDAPAALAALVTCVTAFERG